MSTYKVIDLARMFEIHPNTVRFYEKIGYISKANRKKNGYREFEEKHILQMKICRCIFGYPFINKKIREAGNLVIEASVIGDSELGKKRVYEYVRLIENEIDMAENIEKILKSWVNSKTNKTRYSNEKIYTRKDVGEMLGVTKETIRNWERNQLIVTDKRAESGKVIFDSRDIERIKIIYMIRQVGYGTSAIYRCLNTYDKGNLDHVLIGLNGGNCVDILSVGDRWLYELKKLRKAAQKLHENFSNMKNM